MNLNYLYIFLQNLRASIYILVRVEDHRVYRGCTVHRVVEDTPGIHHISDLSDMCKDTDICPVIKQNFN